MGHRPISLIMLFCSSAIALGTGCGDDPQVFSIRPFERGDDIDMVVGNKIELTVRLNTVPEKQQVVVDITSEDAQFVSVKPLKGSGSCAQGVCTLIYEPLVDPPEKEVEITAEASTNGQWSNINFAIRGTTTKRTYRVKIAEP